ncbi:MAG: pyridoxamine 5'-phosphate oxidase family protein [Candidatus Thiodiazotropha sp.]
MGKQYHEISDRHRDFILRQPMFFVATATRDSRINLSPKGLDSLRILDAKRVVWLNLTGSGNETAAHLAEDGRMTMMFCAFEGDPKILRLYGSATSHQQGSVEWDEHIGHFAPLPGARQIILMNVDLVQSSCGFGVPLFEYLGQRDALPAWSEKKGEAGIRDYWNTRNRRSIDGKDTDFS